MSRWNAKPHTVVGSPRGRRRSPEWKADLLLTLGAGSLTDGAKIIALALANQVHTAEELETLAQGLMKDLKLVNLQYPLSRFQPHCQRENIPTLQVLVILDPKLVQSTPNFIWLSTGIRAVDHCMETLCAIVGVTLQSDELAEHALSLLIPGLLQCKKDRTNTDAHLQCQLGSVDAMAACTSGSVQLGASHGIGHQLGPLGVGHGETSCILLPAVFKFNAAHNANRDRQLRVREFLIRDKVVSEVLQSHSVDAENSDLGDILDVIIRELAIATGAHTPDRQTRAPSDCDETIETESTGARDAETTIARALAKTALGANHPETDQVKGGRAMTEILAAETEENDQPALQMSVAGDIAVTAATDTVMSETETEMENGHPEDIAVHALVPAPRADHQVLNVHYNGAVLYLHSPTPSLPTRSGRLAAESNTVQVQGGEGIVLKYHEPPEARKPPPKEAWRLYVFKGEDLLEMVELNERSCWLIGRERAVVDFPLDHPSCSKQHAALQFRFVEKRNEYGDRIGKVKPYLIDLESSNGSTVNKESIPAGRYVEVMDKDVMRFGTSTREYVLMLPS
ncbi:hypothetical protein N7488_008435 [Penicillium malachiteum]|nr:hypothetical protein N7488_008435 [Penicillium malachiteum]